jgi:hypothetical protein
MSETVSHTTSETQDKGIRPDDSSIFLHDRHTSFLILFFALSHPIHQHDGPLGSYNPLQYFIHPLPPENHTPAARASRITRSDALYKRLPTKTHVMHQM